MFAGAGWAAEGEGRPHLVMMIGEREYETKTSLAAFAERELAEEYRVTRIEAKEGEGDFPGLAGALAEADVLLVSVWRRALPEAQMAALRTYVAAGKPVVGIRTASHAFWLRGAKVPVGCAVWERWDQEVFGGNLAGTCGGFQGGGVSAVVEERDWVGAKVGG